MRALLVAVGLALVVAACGSSSRQPDAAELVPPDALAFVGIDVTDRKAWKSVFELTGRIAPAAGKGTSYAMLAGEDGEPELVALVQSDDDRELRDFVAWLNQGDAEYRVREISGWSVIAASEEAFAAVRAAESGRSLADVEAFQQAMSEVEGESLATAYANGAGLAELRGEIGTLARVVGSPAWVGAKLVAGDNAAQLGLRTDATASVYRPSLLGEVPSGALVAISFKDAGQAVRRLAAEFDEYRALLADLVPAVRGEGIIYVTQGALLPTIVLAVESPNPGAAADALRRLGQTLEDEANGFLSFNVTSRGNRVTLTNGPNPPATPTPRLVDDPGFKDALAAADAPDEVSWLAYADVQRLAPTVQALAQLMGMPLSEEQKGRLGRLGTLVAFGGRSELVLRLSGR